MAPARPPCLRPSREPLPRLRAPTAKSVGEQQARDESPGDVDRHRGTHDPELEVPHQQPGRRDVYREPYGRGRCRAPVLERDCSNLFSGKRMAVVKCCGSMYMLTLLENKA